MLKGNKSNDTESKYQKTENMKIKNVSGKTVTVEFSTKTNTEANRLARIFRAKMIELNTVETLLKCDQNSNSTHLNKPLTRFTRNDHAELFEWTEEELGMRLMVSKSEKGKLLFRLH